MALVPVIFAALTWDHRQAAGSFQLAMRHFSAPVFMIEFVVILLAVAWRAPARATLRRAPSWAKTSAALLGCVILAAAAASSGESVPHKLFPLTWLLHVTFGVAVGAITAAASDVDVQRFWRAVAAGLLGFLVITTAFVATAPQDGSFRWVYFGLAVTNVRHLGNYASVIFGIGIAAVALARGRSALIWGAALCSAGLTLTFWSGTRAAFVAILAATAVGWITSKQIRAWRSAVTLFASAAAATALAAALPAPTPEFGMWRLFGALDPGPELSTRGGRVEIWGIALLKILDRPVLGHGTARIEPERTNGIGIITHPHNSVLQILLQWGVAGASLFFSLIAALWIMLWRTTAADPASHLASFMVATGLLAQSLFEGSLYFAYPIMMIVFCFALSAGVLAHPKPAPVAGTSRSPAPKSADREATGSG
jgi:O-antigen ligase